jgi:DNA-directed RNA polymerase specialized sigma24 family protein
MGINPNTVKVRMFRARRRLTELYRRRYGSPQPVGASAGGRI